jgi:hypothetical protein
MKEMESNCKSPYLRLVNIEALSRLIFRQADTVSFYVLCFEKYNRHLNRAFQRPRWVYDDHRYFCAMKKWGLLCLFAFCLVACKDHADVPDVSAIRVTVEVRRFEKDLFSIDTLQMENSMNRLQQKYPDFLPGFLVKILGINPADPGSTDALRSFIRSYQPVYDTALQVADDALPDLTKELRQSLQLMKYYLPHSRIDSPFVITTFIGPMDAFEPFSLGDYGDVRTANGVGVALQLHLGKDASVYETGRQAGLFYDYQTRRFTPEMMLVNTMKNMVIDAFPYEPVGHTLVDEMIEKGRRLFLLNKLLPNTPDSLKLGYTGEQLKGCYANEALIWNYFVKNDLLYSKDNAINQNYIKDGPKTAELGEGAPGYIGLFTGLQIVNAYMEKNPDVSMEQLMQMDVKTIFNEAGYKP